MPRIRRFFATAALLVAIGSLPCLAEEVIPLRGIGGGLLTARVEIAGEPLWMLVDTGATRSMLRAAVASRLHLKPRARFELATTGGVAEGLCAGPVAARLGTTELAIDCLGWSVAADVTAIDPDLDGILAADALTARPLLIDVRAGILVLDPDPARLGGPTVPLSLEAGRPTLTLAAGDDGATLRLVLDSGAGDLVLFGPAAAAVPPRRQVGLETMTGTRGATIGAPPRLRQLRRAPRQALLLPDLTDRGEDGLLPLAAVGSVALDWQRGVAVLGESR